MFQEPLGFVTAQKIKFSISSISFSDLVTLTEEILIGKLHFLHVTAASSQTQSVTREPQIKLLNPLSANHL